MKQLYSIRQHPETKEYHIFDTDIENGEFVFSTKSKCGLLKKDSKNIKIETGKDENIIRTKCASIGRKVCAICISDFYTTYK